MLVPPKSVRFALLLAFVTGVLLGGNACDNSNPVQPTAPCAFALSSRALSIASAGGPGTVAVETEARCSWTVEGVTGWISLQSPTTMTGSGTVTFTIHPNASPDRREKALMVAGT